MREPKEKRIIGRGKRQYLGELWLWGLLALLCLLVFWPMFRNGFVWDDLKFVVGNKAIQALWPPSHFFFSPGTPSPKTSNPIVQRPVMAFSLALDYAFWKLRPLGYHLTNLLLHLLCVFGVTWLTRRWSGSRVAGFLSGCLFALHSGHAEAVIAFLGRSDLLATLFVLLGFWGYHASLEAVGWRKKAMYDVSIGSYLLACFSKETGLVLLCILVIYEAFFFGKVNSEIRNPKSKIIRLLPFLLVAVFYCWYRGRILGSQVAGSKWWGGSPFTNALMAFEVYSNYLRLLVFPLSLTPLYTVSVPSGLGDGRVLWGALLLLMSLAGTVWALRKRPRLGFWAFWFLLGLIPVANLIPIPGVQIMAERWLYLPSVGACVLGGWGVWVLYNRAQKWTKWVWLALVAGVLILLGVRTFLWIPTWRTEESVARAIVAASPQIAVGYYNLGNAFMQQGEYEEAIEAFRKAIELNPYYALAYGNLGIVLQVQGKNGEAKAAYRRAIELNPGYAKAYNNLGAVLKEQEEYGEAIAAYRKAIELNPGYAKAYNNLGVALQEQGKYGEAIAAYRKAIEFSPDYPEARSNLGVSLWHEGMNAEAEREFREAIRLRSDYVEALENLAEFLDTQGRRGEARSFWERALQSELRTVWVMKITERLKEKD